MNKEYSKSLKKETRSILIDSFEKKCQITVIPFISNQVLCKTKEMMIIDISQMKSDMLIFSKIPEFIIHYQNVAKDMFDNQLQSICNNLINSPQYNSQLTFLNSSICHEVVMIEINERINRIDKISKDNDSRINEIKNMLDEFINVLHQVQENSNQIGQIIGTFFYSARIEDKLPGSLKCNGQIINAAEYPDFVENYLKKKLVALVPINEWHKIKRETNNVGCFGYDQNGGIFIAPFIPSGTFLSNASIEYINGHIMPQGSFLRDQIVNITGVTQFKSVGINNDHLINSGALSSSYSEYWPTWARCNGGSDDWDRAQQIQFDASRSVNTGDRVLPRTIFHNLYVVVSDKK